jgi:arabinofuranan 3-O-arabinosyltransferase
VNAPPSASPRTTRSRLAALFPFGLLAGLTYVPLLLRTAPGEVGADTKSYLYFDPSKMLADAPYLWDPGVGLGTVTHQNVGYLFPMGPFYWAFEQLGVPDWVAQRLWLGSILFAAGAGVLVLLRALDWSALRAQRDATTRSWWDLGMLVAALGYALSPYVLDYAARISVILLPWAALPWLVAFTVLSLRRDGWRWPAAFAVVVLFIASINATALILVGLGPLLWVLYAVVIAKEVKARSALAACARIGVLTLVTSLWWMSGLALQGGYGIPILRYTETYEVVADAAVSLELVRGLGYWFFYGNDKLGQWIVPSIAYSTNSFTLLLSYGLPILSFAAAVMTRFRHRTYFVLLIGVGVLVGVGAHPFDDPSLAGGIFKVFTQADAGLAFRSTPRAVPLVALGSAVLLGAGVNVLGERLSGRLPHARVVVGAVAAVLVVANLPALWQGHMVDRNLKRPEDVPSYWTEAAAHLDSRGQETRVLEIPGSDFAAYRWGNTVDPVTPGFMDRPYVARELIPYGSPPSANLLNAIDRPLQEDTLDPDALAPLARLISAGDIVLRSDLEYERFRTPRPEATWALVSSVPGLGLPTTFGEVVANEPTASLPMIDEVELGTPLGLDDPPPVAVFPVEDAPSIIQALPASGPLLVSGDGDGLVAIAGLSELPTDRAILYSATFADDADAMQAALDEDAALVVTDSNRKRARRWGTIRENEGYTERAGESPLEDDPTDNRLEVFPDAGDDTHTVSVQTGGATVSASAYGNPVTYTAGNRAFFAMDGDPQTAWKVAAFGDPVGEYLRIETDEPVTTGLINLLQPVSGDRNRFITEAALHFSGPDGVSTEEITLDASSRTGSGQDVAFDERTFDSVEIEITADNVGARPKYDGLSGVGFAEVRLPDPSGDTPIVLEEWIRPPVDLLDAAGASSIDHPLQYVFSRQRTNPAEPVRVDEEERLQRLVEVPAGRTFSLTGEARLSAQAPDQLIDQLVGLPTAADGGITASSSARLSGDLMARASSALDNDPATAWSTPFATPEGTWIAVETPEAQTLEGLDLSIVADPRHSLPRSLTVRNEDGDEVTVDLPEITAAEALGHIETVAVELPEAITGTQLRFSLSEVEERTTTSWYSGQPEVLPVALAELGIPGTTVERPSGPLDLGCRSDQQALQGAVTVDGEPLDVALEGTVEQALAREGLPLQLCSAGRAIELDESTHELATAPGQERGFDIDGLVLASEAGGGETGPGDLPPAAAAPPVEVTSEGRVQATVEVDAAEGDEPFWLVLGQSQNLGWHAEVDGLGDLGDPTLIQGYANGWLIDPSQAAVADDGTITVSLEWTPQRSVWFALGGSALGILLCLLLLWRNPTRFARTSAGLPGEGHLIPIQPEVEPLLPAPRGSQPPVRTVAVTAATAFVLTAVLVAPIWAPLVAGAVVLADRWRWGPVAIRITSVGLLALSALSVVVRQRRNAFPPDFIWPGHFDNIHRVVLVAVALLVIDALVGRRGDHTT